MPFLRVKVDGSVVVEIPTDDCNIIACRISGTRDDDTFAGLSASSGIYGQGADDVHRIWLDCQQLVPGQSVEIEFVASGSQVGQGMPFDASGSPGMPAGYSLEDELHKLAQELRNQPWVRTVYKFRYEASHGTTVDCWMAEDEYGFGFNVLWNDMHPGRVSVSLHAYTIDSFEQQRNGRDLVRERVSLEQSCRITLVA